MTDQEEIGQDGEVFIFLRREFHLYQEHVVLPSDLFSLFFLFQIMQRKEIRRCRREFLLRPRVPACSLGVLE